MKWQIVWMLSAVAILAAALCFLYARPGVLRYQYYRGSPGPGPLTRTSEKTSLRVDKLTGQTQWWDDAPVTGTPRWRPGFERTGTKKRTLDGRIVLAKKGTALGAFVCRNQMMQPEGLIYDWYYRTDGKGTFRRSESGSFNKGFGTLSQHNQSGRPFKGLEFGPFSIGWSCPADGEGRLFYHHPDRETLTADSLRICITSETDIEKIDAADAKWLYKATPNDPGIRLGKPRSNVKP